LFPGLKKEIRRAISAQSLARRATRQRRHAQLRGPGQRIRSAELTKEPFAQIPHGRYINFMSDFLAGERGTTWEQALRAWKKLKKLDVPKNYRSWVRLNLSKQV